MIILSRSLSCLCDHLICEHCDAPSSFPLLHWCHPGLPQPPARSSHSAALRTLDCSDCTYCRKYCLISRDYHTLHSTGQHRFPASMSSPIYPGRNRQTFPAPRVFRQVEIRGRKRLQDTVKAEQDQTTSETSPSKTQRHAFINGVKAAAPLKPVSDPAKDLTYGTVDEPIHCEKEDLQPNNKSVRHKGKANDDTAIHPRLDINTVFHWCGQYPGLEQPPHPDATKHYSHSIWEYLAGRILDRTGCRTWIKWVSLFSTTTFALLLPHLEIAFG